MVCPPGFIPYVTASLDLGTWTYMIVRSCLKHRRNVCLRDTGTHTILWSDSDGSRHVWLPGRGVAQWSANSCSVFRVNIIQPFHRSRHAPKVCRGYHVINKKRSIYSSCYMLVSELGIGERSEMAGTLCVHHSATAVRCDAGHKRHTGARHKTCEGPYALRRGGSELRSVET